ncbi:MAG: hypothetical protein HKN87_06885 [Saprospiraceae bacterium]|nr:hypothetical protein [Saprospiraceae bacterium]
MQRDIEVAEQILSTLINQSYDSPVAKKAHLAMIHQPQSIKGSYLEDYGVTFNVSRNFGMPVSRQKHFIRNQRNDLAEEHEVVEIDLEEGDEDLDEITKPIFAFLADYGNLIHQLELTDKIIVKTSHNRTPMVHFFKEHGLTSMHGLVLSVEAVVADLHAYEEGELDKDELYERIIVRENIHDSSKEPQLDVFAAMLERLYQSDLSDSYYLASTPFYDRVEGFGVTYHLKYYSSKIYENDPYSIPAIGKRDLSAEERNEIVESMYPTFLEGLKSNLLDYAHILRNLENTEMLILRIELTQCNGCAMPGEIEVSIKKQMIDDYRKGSLSKQVAMAAIKVKDLQ